MQLHQHLVFTDFRDSRFLECKAIKAIVLVLDDPLLHCRGSHSVNKSRKGMCNRSVIKCTVQIVEGGAVYIPSDLDVCDELSDPLS